MTPELASLCAEIGVTVIPPNQYRGPMMTHAHSTMERILKEHGPEHLRLVLIGIAETGANSRSLVAPVIWAVSDMIRAHPHWLGGKWLEAMDLVDLTQLHARAKANRKAAQPRQAIATLLFDKLSNSLEGKAA